MKEKQSKIKAILLSKYAYIGLFIIGVLVFLYPLISSSINAQTQTKVISDYKQEITQMSKMELDQLKEEAMYYNGFIAELEGNVTDVITEEESNISDIVYMNVLSTGEAIGYLAIPRIDIELPIYRGTSEEVLQYGIGHLERSSLPIGGVSTHCVLTGHRGIPSSRLFRDLDKLRLGDVFAIDTLNEKIAYEVESLQQVLPHEVEALQIQEGRDLCTLITCDPYMINSHRLLVTGHRVDYDPALFEKAAEDQISFFEKYIEYFIIILVFLILFGALLMMRKGVAAKRP